MTRWDLRDAPLGGHCSGKHSLSIMFWMSVHHLESAFALRRVGHLLSEGINKFFLISRH